MAPQYNHTVPLLLSSHLYQSTYKIWKQFDEDLFDEDNVRTTTTVSDTRNND